MQKIIHTTAASLVEDFGFYPRNHVDDTHVNDLARALAAGDTLPPLIVDRASRRIVDGFHRRRAYLKAFGDKAKVPVVYHAYTSDTELLTDAVRLNASHGRKLDRHDQTRIVLLCRTLQVPDQTIAVMLHVPEPVVQQLSIRILQAPSGPIPSKRGLEHMRGQRITIDQQNAIAKVRSGEVGRLCEELSSLVSHDLVDWDNTTVVDQLRALAQLILKTLRGQAANENVDWQARSG